MKLRLKKIHIYLYVFSVALSYFILWPAFYYFSLKPERFKHMNRLRRFWAFLSSSLVGFFYRFKCEQPIDWRKTYIVCPNHTSNLDIAAMCILVNSDCCFMGKEELKDGLVTKLFFRSVDIPVNRENNISAFRAFKKAAEKLKDGHTMIIFPEGKIGTEYPPLLHRFKNGPFKLAIEMKVPILPVSSANIWEMLWDDGTEYGTRPGVCDFFVHAPIPTAHLTADDADSLRDEVYNIISKKIAHKIPAQPLF